MLDVNAEAAEIWRKLCTEVWYYRKDNSRLMLWRKTRWAARVACMEGTWNACKLLSVKLYGTAHMLDRGRNGRIKLDLLRSAFFCHITQCRVKIPYRRFGKTYRSHRQKVKKSQKKLCKELPPYAE